MAVTAEALQRAEPELIPVTSMRLHMVSNNRTHNQALLQAEGAQRVHLHLKFLLVFPASEPVPGTRIA
jgi:hypothetical protein